MTTIPPLPARPRHRAPVLLDHIGGHEERTVPIVIVIQGTGAVGGVEVSGRRENDGKGVVAVVQEVILTSAVDDAVTVGVETGVVVMTMATATVEAPTMVRMRGRITLDTTTIITINLHRTIHPIILGIIGSQHLSQRQLTIQQLKANHDCQHQLP